MGPVLAGLLAHGTAQAACTITVTPVAFGNYDPRSAAPDDGTGTINVRCLFNDAAPTVGLGMGGSGIYASRQMSSGPWDLNYNLYTTPAHNVVWGNGSAGTVPVTLSGLLAFPFINYSRTIYGRIPARQNVGAGTYGDTVVVTVTW